MTHLLLGVHHTMLEIDITLIGLGLLAYLLGSLSSAVILCQLFGLPDPRTQGSGNPGATNVLRMGSKKLAASVLGLDVLKGVVAILIARAVVDHELSLAVVALAVFLGHLYPVFFGFKGGKGVATALGAFLAWMPVVAGLALLTWLLIFAVSRISSLSAISASILVPVYAWWWLEDRAAWAVVVVISALLLWRHRANIKRLLRGEEPASRFGRS